MLITTTNGVEGRKVVEYKGIVFGIEHYCSHAVSSENAMYRKPDEPPLAYNFTKMFLRYEF